MTPRSVSPSTLALLKDWIERIKEWRENDDLGFNAALELLCELQVEMERHLKTLRKPLVVSTK